jgi:hypothetical protein
MGNLLLLGLCCFWLEGMAAFACFIIPPVFTLEDLSPLETPESFGNYCKHIGVNDPIYWQKIYTRLDLEYTSTSPRGNAVANSK